MEYNELSRQELIGYLMDFVEGLEQHSLDADEQGFVELHKKIIWELCHDRIYKVTFCRPDQQAQSKLAEYDTQYFSSLKEAKRELHRRMKRLQKQSVLALPEEIQNHRLLPSTGAGSEHHQQPGSSTGRGRAALSVLRAADLAAGGDPSGADAVERSDNRAFRSGRDSALPDRPQAWKGDFLYRYPAQFVTLPAREKTGL